MTLHVPGFCEKCGYFVDNLTDALCDKCAGRVDDEEDDEEEGSDGR